MNARVNRGCAVMFGLLLAGGCTATIGDGSGGGGAGDVDSGPGGPGPGAADAAACDQVTPIMVSRPEPPDLMLVVDKSGSMGENLGGGGQKWSVMRQALIGIVGSYDDRIDFGLMTFPSDNVCGPGAVRVPVQAGSSTLISGALLLTSPEGGTPTHTTMSGALAYYQSAPPNPSGRFALLATDGQPNCISANDPNVPTVNESIAAVQALQSAGVSTYVLGFGDAVVSDPTTLQLLAQAGGTSNYYAATSPAQLQAALDTIVGQISVPPCTVGLQEVPGDPAQIGVYFDDVPVPRTPGHIDGWDYNAGSNSVILYGAACDQLQSGNVSALRIDYGCEGPVVL